MGNRAAVRSDAYGKTGVGLRVSTTVFFGVYMVLEGDRAINHHVLTPSVDVYIQGISQATVVYFTHIVAMSTTVVGISLVLFIFNIIFRKFNRLMPGGYVAYVR